MFKQGKAGKTQLNGLQGGHSGGRSPGAIFTNKAGTASWRWYDAATMLWSSWSASAEIVEWGSGCRDDDASTPIERVIPRAVWTGSWACCCTRASTPAASDAEMRAMRVGEGGRILLVDRGRIGSSSRCKDGAPRAIVFTPPVARMPIASA